MTPTRTIAVLLAATALCSSPLVADGPPALPEGLDDPVKKKPARPALPGGLEDGPGLPPGLDEGPKLPTGLDEPKTPRKDEKPDERPAAKWLENWNVTGFWEVRGGLRTQHDPYERDASIGETRLQLKVERPWQTVTFRLTADLLYDAVVDRHEVDLDTGEGFFDLREASVTFSPATFMDVKAGRQILTWGTGDLLFINDLFPKDWQSFFAGRDEEYLKAPSDAMKVSFFSKVVNLDVVFTPRFNADRHLTGRRTSFWRSSLGRRAGRDAIVDVDERDDCGDHEWATRLWRNVGGYELAAYGYWGFWKSPAGMNAAGEATFPRLGVYGASARGPVGKGIGNIEVGYYDSRQDRGGDDPMIANSQARILAGYEQDLPWLARDLTVGVQYYVEWMMDYGDYRRTLPPGAKAADEDRHLVTIRLTKKLMNQNLTLSLFAYYSPTDSDAYLRPKASYKIDDHWTAEVGGNVFLGAHSHTFFGQFDRNSNVYAALRYGF